MTVIATDAETFRRALEGRTVVSYAGDEMALWEQGSDGLPVFEHPQIPCAQCGSLTLAFDDGSKLCIHTNLWDDSRGLILVDDPPDEGLFEIDLDPESIYRKAELDRFPAGRITRVDVTVDGIVRAITLAFGDRAVSMVAGEFEEQFDGSLRLVPDDESILFFPTGDGLAWAEAQVARGHIRSDSRA